MKVCFVGLMRTGKSTCAEYLEKMYGFNLLSIAHPVKKLARQYFGMGLLEKNRPLLQKLGMKFREIDDDVWINWLIKRTHGRQEEAKEYDKDYVLSFAVDDVRFINEAKRLKDEGFILVKVVRNIEYSKEQIEQLKHPSELDAEKITCDYIVENNGTFEDLYKQLDKILTEVDDGILQTDLHEVQEETRKGN